MRKKGWIIFTIILLSLSFASCANDTTATSSENITQQPEETKNLYPAYKIEKSDKTWGYINEEGKFLIEPQFQYVEAFQDNGIAKVYKDDMQGLINLKGEIIVDPIYTSINDFTEEYAIANKNWEEYFIIDEKGNTKYKSENLIESVKDGIVIFGEQEDQWKYNYGYMDINGNVIIEPQYTYATQFIDGKAIVGLEEGKYAIINKEGNIEFEFDSQYIPHISEGIIVISKDYGNYNVKNEYMKMDGTMLTDQIFYQANTFDNGVAIAQLGEDDDYKYVLINKEGKIIIEEAAISYIGNNYFSVSKGSDLYSNYLANMYFKNAIFSSEGKQLTDYSYYNASSISDGLISVSDETSTFIINDNGEMVTEYPKRNGVGTISAVGQLLKAELDGDLIYFNKDGKIIWQSDNTIALGDGIIAEQHKYRPDRLMYIEYPEIKGLKNQEVQNKINNEMKNIFIADDLKSEEDDEFIADTTTSYFIEKNKDIIILSKSDSYYPLGAAHGGGYLTYYHFNINDGKFYELSDLFKKDSNYLNKLKNIINKQIAIENQDGMAYFENHIELREDQDFAIYEDYLEIYFQQYEIAPYAAGFPSFQIPYGDIIDIIDTDGEFWNAFEKNITTSEKCGLETNEVSDDISDSILNLINSYENNLVDAINNNNFELVKPNLLEGSDLYKSQEELVTKLYNLSTKERLDDFVVSDIIPNDGGYSVYVQEKVGIQYLEKEFEVKNFNWIYTVVYEEASDKYMLTGIEKWNK